MVQQNLFFSFLKTAPEKLGGDFIMRLSSINPEKPYVAFAGVLER